MYSSTRMDIYGRFFENFNILLQFVQSPYFTPETVAKEQGIIGQEIKMYQDNPDWEVMFNLLRILYQKNPVRIDIAGTVESIAQISADLLYECYNTFYNLSNMVLAVAGNVTPEQVLKTVDEKIEKEEPVRIIRETEEEPFDIVTDYIEEDMHTEIKKFNIGYKEKVREETKKQMIESAKHSPGSLSGPSLKVIDFANASGEELEKYISMAKRGELKNI